MVNPELKMREYYAARAPEYDRVYEKPERQSDIGRLISWLPPLFEAARVLDVASGTGFWTQFIAPVAREVVAIDTSLETMAIARERLPGDKVRFVVADAYEIPKDIGVFEAAFVGFWFSHVPKGRRREFLGGLQRVITPGGVVVLLDNRYVEGSNHPISGVDTGGNTYQTRQLTDGSTHQVLKNFPSKAELQDAVGEFGEALVYTEFDYYWAVAYTSISARHRSAAGA